MKLELFDHDDKLKELEVFLVTHYEHCVMARSLSQGACSIRPFSTHGRGLFSPVSKQQEKRGKFLKKLWCCVGGKYNEIIGFYQLG